MIVGLNDVDINLSITSSFESPLFDPELYTIIF